MATLDDIANTIDITNGKPRFNADRALNLRNSQKLKKEIERVNSELGRELGQVKNITTGLLNLVAQDSTKLTKEATNSIQNLLKVSQGLESASEKLFEMSKSLPNSLVQVKFPEMLGLDIKSLMRLEDAVSQMKPEVNVSKINFPRPDVTVEVKEIPGLLRAVNQLIKATKQIRVDLKAPDVRVEIPIEGIQRALDEIGLKGNSASNPVAVRLSDGETFYTALSGMFTSGGGSGGGINASCGTVTTGSKALSSASSAVQIDSTDTKIKFIDLCANAGLVAVGDSSAVSTSGSEVGTILYPGNVPYRMQIDNLAKVYAAGASGTRVTWSYYV